MQKGREAAKLSRKRKKLYTEMLEKKVNELENKVKYGEFLLSKTKNKMKNLFNQIPTIKESYTLKANYGIKLA